MIDEFNEKRKHIRINIGIPLQYKNLRELSEGTIGAITRDMSEAGVRFISNEFLPLASRLVVQIFLPAQPRPVKAIAKVAWIKKSSSDSQYEVGNYFLEVDREDKKQLTEYINKSRTLTL